MTFADLLEELWTLRDAASLVDDAAAGQIHALYNRLVVLGPA